MILIKKLLNSIKREYPENAVYMSKLIGQVQDQVEAIIGKYSLEEDKDIFVEELIEITHIIEEIKNELDINYGQLTMGKVRRESIGEEEKLNPNYENYKVDNTIEHSLFEDLTHIRPYGFKYGTCEIIKAGTWKDVFIKTCEELLKIDEKKFMNFEKLTRMNGELRDYFSTDSSNMILPIKIMNKIYITTSMSANGYSELIVKMLKEYDYDVEKYKLYFSADYSPLHLKF